MPKHKICFLSVSDKKNVSFEFFTQPFLKDLNLTVGKTLIRIR